MKCSKCDAENHDSATFCKKCGGSFFPDSVCKKCGTKNEEDAVFCVKCGDNLIENKAVIHEIHTDKASKFIHNKKRKNRIIISVVSVMTIIIALLAIFVVRPQILRSEVDKFIEKTQYTKAQTTYEKLPDYMKDDTEYLYISLLSDLEKGNYVDATAKLVRLGGYEDAAGMLDKSNEFIQMLVDGGIKLPSGQATKISDKIESIAEQAAKDTKVEQVEKVKAIDSTLIGLWAVTRFRTSDGEWIEQSHDDYLNGVSPATDRSIKFNSDGTYHSTGGTPVFGQGDGTYYTDSSYIYFHSKYGDYKCKYTITGDVLKLNDVDNFIIERLE